MGLSLCLMCNLGAIHDRFGRGFGSVLFAVLFLHLTKNSPKTARNCAQITHKTQRQPHVKVIEVYFHIHNFILAFWKPKSISHTKSYSECHITRKYSHFELGRSVMRQIRHTVMDRLRKIVPSHDHNWEQKNLSVYFFYSCLPISVI